ncbi:DUF4258 domain-containing protein [Thermococcus sp.]|nr:DUF4258 domain-containing protein [Thermococcus sp.]
MIVFGHKIHSHALERIKERGIYRELVEDVLLSPDIILEGHLGRKWHKK